MTSDILYKDKLDEYIKQYKGKFNVPLTPLDPKDGLKLKKAIEMDSVLATQLAQRKPPPLAIDFRARIEELVAPSRTKYNHLLEAADISEQQKRQTEQQKYEAAVAQAEQVAADSVSELTKAYDQLLTYRDKVASAVLRYNVKPSDLELDMDSLTREDMEALVEQALDSCSYLTESNFRQKLNFLYTPTANDRETRAYHALAITAGLIVLSPILFFAIVGYLGWNMFHIYPHVDGLRIADKLMYGIDFNKFRDVPKIEEIPKPDEALIVEHANKVRAKAAAQDPAKLEDEYNKLLASSSDEITGKIKAATDEVLKEWMEALTRIKKHKEEAERLFSEFMENQTNFYETASESFVLSYEAVLGKAEGVIDQRYPVFEKNLVFADNSAPMVDFMKLLLANFLLNVRPKQLEVIIYDPERLGQDFATFLDDRTKDYVHVETGGFEKIMSGLRAFSQQGFKILDTQSIAAFNEDAASKGKVTREYKLLLMPCVVDELFSSRAYTQFMQSCVRSGVHIWAVSPNPVPECTFYSKPFENVPNPYPIDQSMFTKAASAYADKIGKLKDSGILYCPAFQAKYMPREKWWQDNTDKGIKLNFGLQDGDPSRGFDIMLGDANVHGLCVGATGAGKSAFINQLLATLVTRYPPSSLKMILIDFKNVEFASLTDQSTHLGRIPHAQIIAGTKDGEYAISVFDFLLKEMEWRNQVFPQVGAKKLEDYNRIMRNQGTPEKCMPRILLLIDEFQVMFTEVDPKSVEIIKARIQSLSKLARSAGVHMFFTSQSMKGTMSKDIMDQFSLRVALRCSSDTSSGIIGSDVASKIKSKFGYLYTNTNAGETQDSTQLWRTPFLPDADWFQDKAKAEDIKKGKAPEGSLPILTEICQMSDADAREKGYRAYFYDAKEVWSGDYMKQWMEDNRATLEANPGLFLLGERTGFSLNKAPCNFRMMASDGENLLLYAFEPVHLQDLIMTMVNNIKFNPKNILLMNCADPEVWDILGVGDIVGPGFAEISRPTSDPTEWIEFLENAIATRKEEGMAGKRPIYFFAVRWDKQMKICRDEDYKLSGRWKAILQNGPSVDVHVIMCIQLYKDLPMQHIPLYNHRICAKGPGDAGYRLIENGKIDKFDPEEAPMALYSYGQDLVKFKIYAHTYSKVAQARELFI